MAELRRHNPHGHDLRTEDQMTVAELITELQRFDKDLEVMVRDREDDFLYEIFNPAVREQEKYDSVQRKFLPVTVVTL